MLRKVSYLLWLAVFGLGFAWLADNPGEFSLRWLGYEIETSVYFIALAALVFAVLVWAVLSLIAAGARLPSEMARNNAARRQQKGLDALTEAFIALGEQNPQAAQRHVQRATSLLPDSSLPHLLQAQLYRQADNSTALRNEFTALQSHAKTRALALKGLVEEARARGAMDEALAQAQELQRNTPRSATALVTLADLLSYHHRTEEAVQLLQRSRWSRIMPARRLKHLMAVVYAEGALHLLSQGKEEAAGSYLRKAVARAPELTAASLLLAQQHYKNKDSSAAEKILVRAWKHQPHEATLALMLQNNADLDAELLALKLENLARQNGEAVESTLAFSEAALRRRQPEKARQILQDALERRPQPSLFQALDALDNGLVQEANPLDVPSSWNCLQCATLLPAWQAHCPVCRYFDTVQWKTPFYPVIRA